MTDWSKPALTDGYASVLTELMGRDTDAATQFVGTSSTNIPNGAIRWNPATYRWETFNSTAGTWSAWSTQINIGTVLLGTNSASGTMQAVPRSQADTLYQPVGSYQPAGNYAFVGGASGQTFLAANSAAATQQVVPRAQADTLYQPVGSYAAQSSIGNLGGAIAPDAGGVLPATAFGQAIQVNTGAAVTLPASGNLGEVLYLYPGGGAWTLQADSSHFIYAPSIGLGSTTNGTVMTVPGLDMVVMSRGGAEYNIIGGGVLVVGAANTWTKSQSATVQALAYATTITPDLTAGNDAAVTLTGNATLANPSAMTPGTSGHIAITQDATGGRTMGYGSYWKFGSNGTPTLSTAANAEDVLVYWVRDATHIIASIVQGVQ